MSKCDVLLLPAVQYLLGTSGTFWVLKTISPVDFQSRYCLVAKNLLRAFVVLWHRLWAMQCHQDGEGSLEECIRWRTSRTSEYWFVQTVNDDQIWIKRVLHSKFGWTQKNCSGIVRSIRTWDTAQTRVRTHELINQHCFNKSMSSQDHKARANKQATSSRNCSRVLRMRTSQSKRREWWFCHTWGMFHYFTVMVMRNPPLKNRKRRFSVFG